jgi:hypothetical protein
MNPVKDSRGALLALLAAGGWYAWRNRDKIQSWLNTQRDQVNTQLDSGSQFSGGMPSTGETRQIDQGGYPSLDQDRGVYNDPLDRDR